jgi:hypothetical protein
MHVPRHAESFARLYKRRNVDQKIDILKIEIKFGCLKSTTLALPMPCEWMHVHCNGHLHSEECVHSPFIERRPEGCHFDVTCETGVSLRSSET